MHGLNTALLGDFEKHFILHLVAGGKVDSFRIPFRRSKSLCGFQSCHVIQSCPHLYLTSPRTYDFGLGGVFCRTLQFPPALTLGHDLSLTWQKKVTINTISNSKYISHFWSWNTSEDTVNTAISRDVNGVAFVLHMRVFGESCHRTGSSVWTKIECLRWSVPLQPSCQKHTKERWKDHNRGTGWHTLH